LSGERFLHELVARDLMADCTDFDALEARLARGPTRFYCGFDPTADSLHVGSLTPLAVMRLGRRYGHEPILLVGGATGMIGDPSGRSAVRSFLEPDELDRNAAALRAQLLELLPSDGTTPIVLDNREWFGEMTVIEFLRDVGKHVPVSEMLERTSVKSRIDEGGLTFTEQSYQVLQAYDHAYLRRHYDCELQVGGSDQWGNITAGTDYSRRIGAGTAYGLVWPLLLKPDGEKFGKTAQGNVWLDPRRTSAYRFHQFWLNQPDDMARMLLLRFTLRSVEEIDAIVAEHERDRGQRRAQRVLARDVTEWVHGEGSATGPEQAAQILFGAVSGGELDAGLDVLEQELGSLRITRAEAEEEPIERLAVRAGLCPSVSDARRTIKGGGLYVDGRKVSSDGPYEFAGSSWAILRRGKRENALLLIAG